MTLKSASSPQVNRDKAFATTQTRLINLRKLLASRSGVIIEEHQGQMGSNGMECAGPTYYLVGVPEGDKKYYKTIDEVEAALAWVKS